MVGAEAPRRAAPRRRRGELAERRDAAAPLRRSAVFGPIPGTSAGGASREALARLLARQDDEPARASRRRDATLATSLFGPMPTEQPSPVALADLVARAGASRPSARRSPVEVEVGLVEPDLLDALDVRAHERP